MGGQILTNRGALESFFERRVCSSLVGSLNKGFDIVSPLCTHGLRRELDERVKGKPGLPDICLS